MLDVLKPLQHKKLIEYELEGFGIRLNKNPPNIHFRRKDKGGINLTSTVSKSLLSENGDIISLHFHYSYKRKAVYISLLE